MSENNAAVEASTALSSPDDTLGGAGCRPVVQTDVTFDVIDTTFLLTHDRAQAMPLQLSGTACNLRNRCVHHCSRICP